MEEDKEESSKKQLRQDNPPATAASLFTDDLILEILSRLPARSVRRFKCVSMPWRDLIADPVNRKKLPQTLAGFLYTTYRSLGAVWSHHFASVSGGAAPVDPSLNFLQPKYKYIAYVDTCNGLLLCACSNKENPAAYGEQVRYVVCNPATERWIELPPQPQAQANRFHCASRLAFDPNVSSHFHVLEFVETYMDVGSCVTGVDIFSSQTGAWIRRDSELVEQITVFDEFRSVRFGGMLHLVGKLNPVNIYNEPALLVVDMEGKEWKTILLPDGSSSYDAIGLSQGCLHYASTTQAHVSNNSKKNAGIATKITLWRLENYDSKEWVLKCSASIDEPSNMPGLKWRVFAIHPDCDTVFLDGGDVLAAYDMQHQKFVRIINFEKGSYQVYLPYVPLFSEVLADADEQ
ncbi:putative F-box/kelch-repeat protein At4g22430 [Lolium rigidum]|uniref:putative F-box/kelch-repeat protein At4g22430 n=1 Tax=Lolium rigidum TaxID=89674 RepID=UPI001F5D6F16|nr:putative F-box/kelch-repeat protein At4g22430 [Lolium rigidum]